MSNQRVVVLTDDEIEGGLALLKGALGNGIALAKLGSPLDDSIPDWLVSLVEKFQHPGGITDEMVERGIDALMKDALFVSESRYDAKTTIRSIWAALFPGDGEL